MEINIGSKSTETDWLSNFAPTSFQVGEIQFASVEGFLQGIKFPEEDPRRTEAFRSVGINAKRLGRGAERKFVWWRGRKIVYRSVRHLALIQRAIRAKFEQNQDARKALIATEGMTITHDLGHPESPKTSLPSNIFCYILMKIREKYSSESASS